MNVVFRQTLVFNTVMPVFYGALYACAAWSELFGQFKLEALDLFEANVLPTTVVQQAAYFGSAIVLGLLCFCIFPPEEQQQEEEAQTTNDHRD